MKNSLTQKKSKLASVSSVPDEVVVPVESVPEKIDYSLDEISMEIKKQYLDAFNEFTSWYKTKSDKNEFGLVSQDDPMTNFVESLVRYLKNDLPSDFDLAKIMDFSEYNQFIDTCYKGTTKDNIDIKKQWLFDKFYVGGFTLHQDALLKHPTLLQYKEENELTSQPSFFVERRIETNVDGTKEANFYMNDSKNNINSVKDFSRKTFDIDVGYGITEIIDSLKKLEDAFDNKGLNKDSENFKNIQNMLTKVFEEKYKNFEHQPSVKFIIEWDQFKEKLSKFLNNPNKNSLIIKNLITSNSPEILEYRGIPSDKLFIYNEKLFTRNNVLNNFIQDWNLDAMISFN